MKKEVSTWTLKGISGEFQGNSLAITLPMMTLGRTSQNHIVIDDKNISRTHVTFFIHDDDVYIQDEKSRNGTLINEKQIPPGSKVKLKHADRILIGPHAFVLELEMKPVSELSQPVISRSMDTKGESSQYTSTLKTPFQERFKLPKIALNRRSLMYGIAGLFVLFMIGTQFPSKKAKKKSAEPAATVDIKTNSSSSGKTIVLDDAELDALKTQAKATMQFQDYLAATELYEKIVKASPNDEYAKSQYEFAKNELSKKIALHLEYAKREFEKLNYERAIIEWKQVLALTIKANPDVYKQTEQKITDAEKELQKRR